MGVVAAVSLIADKVMVPMLIGAAGGHLTAALLIERQEARQHRRYLAAYAAVVFGAGIYYVGRVAYDLTQLLR